MNRSTYALKSHLTTFPSSTDGEEQSFCQIREASGKGLPTHAPFDFKGITATPLVFARTSTPPHTHTTIKACKPQNVWKPAQNTAVPMQTLWRAKLMFPIGFTSLPMITAHLRIYAGKMHALPIMPNTRWNSPVNSPSTNRDLIYEWQKTHGLGLD